MTRPNQRILTAMASAASSQREGAVARRAFEDAVPMMGGAQQMRHGTSAVIIAKAQSGLRQGTHLMPSCLDLLPSGLLCRPAWLALITLDCGVAPPRGSQFR